MATAASEEKTSIKLIGKPMDKAEWSAAIDRLGGKGKAKIVLPKPLGEYSGKIIQVSETHIVQQNGKGIAVAHDITKLNFGDISKGTVSGNLTEIMGKDFDFKYDAEKGVGKHVTFNERRAEYVKEEAKKWAETNITKDVARKAFLKHIEDFSNHLAIPKERKAEKAVDMPAAKPERAPSPGR